MSSYKMRFVLTLKLSIRVYNYILWMVQQSDSEWSYRSNKLFVIINFNLSYYYIIIMECDEKTAELVF